MAVGADFGLGEEVVEQDELSGNFVFVWSYLLRENAKFWITVSFRHIT